MEFFGNFAKCWERARGPEILGPRHPTGDAYL
jgi:hypothetical protein